MLKSKKDLIKKYDKKFWKDFKIKSDKYLPQIVGNMPNIGDSVFSFNYKFGPCYIAWYKSFKELNVLDDEIDKNIWLMNERMCDIIPWRMLKFVGKTYLNGFRKKAAKHIERQKNGQLHPYDWKIDYREN